MTRATAMRAMAATLPHSSKSSGYLQWWLLLALFFEYARPGSFLSGINALRLNSLIPLSLVVACVFAANLRPLREIWADPMTKWLLGFFGLITLSLSHAEVTLYAYDVTKTVLGYVLLAFVIVRVCTTTKRIHGVFAVLILSHLFLILMNPAVVTNPQQRSYIAGATFLGDGNDFSLSVCILIPMAVELAFASKSKLLKIVCWGIVILLLLAVIGTQSRGGTLGLIAIGLYLWWRSPRKALTLMLALIVVGVVLAYAPAEYFGRMNTISTYQQDGSAMGRITAWKAAIRMCADNPLLGMGAGMFPVSFGTKYRPEEHMPWLTAHSMYFLVLGELGVPGIITLFALTIGNFRANQRVVRSSLVNTTDPQARGFLNEEQRLLQLLSASVIGFAVSGAFLSVAYYPHIFVLTGLMISARRVATLRPGVAGPSHRMLNRSARSATLTSATR